MNTALSNEQIESYRQNGFLAIDDLLDADELATSRQAVDKAVAETVAQDASSNDVRHNQGGEDSYYKRVFVHGRLASSISAPGFRSGFSDGGVVVLLQTR